MKNRKAWGLVAVLATGMVVGSGLGLHRTYAFRLLLVGDGGVRYGTVQLRRNRGGLTRYVQLGFVTVAWSRRLP
jgi:hypothetical protein